MISMQTAVMRFIDNVNLHDDKKIRHSIDYLESHGIYHYFDTKIIKMVMGQKVRLRINLESRPCPSCNERFKGPLGVQAHQGHALH